MKEYNVFYKDLRRSLLIKLFDKEFFKKEIALESLIKFLLKNKENIDDIYIKENNDIIEIKVEEDTYYIVGKELK